MRKPAVILRSIRKSYPLRNVLDGLNMTVDEGDLFGIVGPKGSGKTTSLKVILGQARIQGGKVIFGPQYGGGSANGRNVCASVMAEPFIPGIAIAHYLKKYPFFQKPELWSKVEQAFQLVGFTMQDKRYRDLTGIEKRRLAIGLALIRDPKILLLDDPFRDLDDAESRQLADLLRKLNQDMGITIIFTARSLEDARKAAERIVFFERGTASRAFATCEL